MIAACRTLVPAYMIDSLVLTCLPAGSPDAACFKLMRSSGDELFDPYVLYEHLTACCWEQWDRGELLALQELARAFWQLHWASLGLPAASTVN